MKRIAQYILGFTLVEVIVSLMIILVVAAGILSSFVVSARYVRNSKDRITSADLNRLKFEDLRQGVRQDTWESGTLSGGSNNTTNYTVGNFTYNVAYNVTNSSGQYRNVTMRINYTTLD